MDNDVPTLLRVYTDFIYGEEVEIKVYSSGRTREFPELEDEQLFEEQETNEET